MLCWPRGRSHESSRKVLQTEELCAPIPAFLWQRREVPALSSWEGFRTGSILGGQLVKGKKDQLYGLCKGREACKEERGSSPGDVILRSPMKLCHSVENLSTKRANRAWLNHLGESISCALQNNVLSQSWTLWVEDRGTVWNSNGNDWANFSHNSPQGFVPKVWAAREPSH